MVKGWVVKTTDPWLETRKHSNRLMIFALILISLPIIGIGLATTRSVLPYDRAIHTIQAHIPSVWDQETLARYQCADSKTIEASFLNSAVDLTLSDGRRVHFPQTFSDTGARFANPDGSFVFMDQDNAAYVVEGNVQTYRACVTNQ